MYQIQLYLITGTINSYGVNFSKPTGCFVSTGKASWYGDNIHANGSLSGLNIQASSSSNIFNSTTVQPSNIQLLIIIKD